MNTTITPHSNKHEIHGPFGIDQLLVLKNTDLILPQIATIIPAASAQIKLGTKCAQDSQCGSNKCVDAYCQRKWSQVPFSPSRSLLSDWGKVDEKYGEKNKVATAANSLAVTYPAGSKQPSGSGVTGGTGFYSTPMDLSSANVITLEYSVFFGNGFKFVKGGKLPGLYGGRQSCSGGDNALDCFSTRYMVRSHPRNLLIANRQWREKGQGELYWYVNRALQTSAFIKTPGLIHDVNADFGWSIGRGYWTFKTNAWTKLKQVVTLNTFDNNGKPLANGKIVVYVNGEAKLTMDKIALRKTASIKAIGIQFDTFFGGNDAIYETPTTQRVFFKDFTLSAY